MNSSGAHTLYLSLFTVALLSACATTPPAVTEIDIAPDAPSEVIHSAFITLHGGTSADVDGDIRRAILTRGLVETEGDGASARAKGADIVITYDADWHWHFGMYLRTLDIQFFDGRTGRLIADALWETSEAQEIHDAGPIVSDLINQTLDKLAYMRNQISN